ncbi:uncharacterized protein LOC132204176 isoform X2 [Neocloeon triangulifer]|nr:uncharacterized protein LOC132204176 isoform X2 [Neocloeon triangulifer]
MDWDILKQLTALTVVIKELVDEAKRTQFQMLLLRESVRAVSENEHASDEFELLLQQILDSTTNYKKSKEPYEEMLPEVIEGSNLLRKGLSAAIKKLDDFKNEFQHKKCDIARSSIFNVLSNGKKYIFSFPVKVTWSVANKSCDVMGLHLATLRNQNDLDAVYDKIRETYGKRLQWWVSGYNFAGDGNFDFRWHDGTYLDENSDLWMMDTKKKGNCVDLWTGNDVNKLYAGICHQPRYFICELPTYCY